MVIMNYMKPFEVKDNFLSEVDFKKVTDAIIDGDIHWLYSKAVAGMTEQEDDNYGYYLSNIGTDHPFYNFMNPIYDKLGIDTLVDTIYRLRTMHYPRTHTLVKHPLHRDQNHSVQTMLLFLNTCDGYTYFKEQDKKLYSVANTAVIFDSINLHHSTTTTNANRRLCLQVSWKG